MSKLSLDTEDVSNFAAQGSYDDDVDLEGTLGLLKEGNTLRQEFRKLEDLG